MKCRQTLSSLLTLNQPKVLCLDKTTGKGKDGTANACHIVACCLFMVLSKLKIVIRDRWGVVLAVSS